MHKKLASDLTSIAHSILQMKNKEDVFVLKQKAYEVYEKLSVLAYVEEYINNTPNSSKTKEQLLNSILLAEKNRIEKSNSITHIVEDNKIINQLDQAPIVAVTKYKDEDEVKFGQDVENTLESNKEVKKEVDFNEQSEIALDDELTSTNSKQLDKQSVVELNQSNQQSVSSHKDLHERVDEKLKDAIDQSIDEIVASKVALEEVEKIIEQPFDEIEELLFKDADVKSNLEEEVEKKAPTLEEELYGTISVDIMADLFEKRDVKKSLNDHLQSSIQIDLNDRIVFVKHLFDGNQNDFNRVVSQLNTFKTDADAKNFIFKMIKPDYDWTGKEEYETRLLEIIERRFA
ncbi:hypothetical protein [Tenacibaculum aestuariivivum]|uniref:hypothetical protein n=1 Tax=Tenacibaculum aestuariivivum TaxID=2006131 RepID=UPI003AB17D08